MFRIVLLLVLRLAAVRALQWSGRFQDKSGPMEVCSGQHIRLFWNYTLNKGEKVKDMVWTCQPKGQKVAMMASFVDGHFVPESEFSGRLSHLTDGGIELSCATILESGNYTVAVRTVDNSGIETLHRQTAWVKVVDTPKTQSGQLAVGQDRTAVLDDVSGQWHVRLTCGHFSDLGHPPVEVDWKTPDGQTLSSSFFRQGNFHLFLSSPVRGGDYTCSLPSLSPATRCLPLTSPLRDDVTVDVDEAAARFSIMEARLTQMTEKLTQMTEKQTQMTEKQTQMTEKQAQMRDDMQKENERLQAQMTRRQTQMTEKQTQMTEKLTQMTEEQTQMTEKQTQMRDDMQKENQRLHGVIADLRNETKTLRRGLATATLTVSFHARLTSDFPGSGTLKPFAVITNEGQAFNGKSGVFTAPVNGLYVFLASAGTWNSDKYVDMYLRKDGVDVSRAYTQQYSGYDTMGSVQATLRLTTGQQVLLYSGSSNGNYYYRTTSFTGFLIHADA